MEPTLPRVALIGRPNVGKSTLFNRLVGHRAAIVEDMPGVTRDRKYGKTDWNGLEFTIIDTGGLEPKTDDEILRAMRKQTDLAIEESDLVIFVVDGREGCLPQDAEIVKRFRQEERPCIIAVNKVDSHKQEIFLTDFYSLGIEAMSPISSIHGSGVGDLLDDVVIKLLEIFPHLARPDVEEETFEPFEEIEIDPDALGDPDDPESLESLDSAKRDQDELRENLIPRIAVIGKPNAGKSTLINHILGEERLLTMDLPGTTRDAIDIELERDGKKYLFIDTAGMRRKKYVKDSLEHYMVGRSLDALGRSDVVLLMIDATEGATEQDAKVAGVAHNKGRGVIIIVNKWDLKENTKESMREYEENLRRRLRFLKYAPVLFCSAQTGLRVPKIFQMIEIVFASYRQRVPTGQLNRFFTAMLEYHPPPPHKRRPVKFYYITQARTRPPTFMISANKPDAAHVTYQRFIINSIREEFGFEGSPIKLFFRQR